MRNGNEEEGIVMGGKILQETALSNQHYQWIESCISNIN